MADNSSLPVASGNETFANDDIGGVKYPRAKLALGADGSAADAVGGSGVVGTGVQRVVLATDVGLPAGTAAIGKVKVTNDAGTVIDPVAAGSAAMAASVPVTIATNDTQFTALLAALTVRTVQLVPTCDATACANLDVLAATEVLSTISRGNDIDCVLRSMTVTRLDSTTGLAMRIWFLKANSSVGAENAAFAPADADADDLLFYIDTAAADFKGTTGMVNCFAQYMNLDYNVKVATGTDDCYIAIQCLEAIDIGAATDIVLTFGFM